MNKTTKNNELMLEKLLVDTEELKYMLSCGRKTAVDIGEESESKVLCGRRVLWNVQKIKEHIYGIAM
jgi:hypothetical protein